MKAVICTKYGRPEEVLKIVDVEKPKPGSRELLIKIKASAVNSGDVRVRGLAIPGFAKIVIRFVLGFNKPRNPILGTVYSGVVLETGSKVNDFAVGDEVYGLTGFKFSAHAEYIAVSEKSTVTFKPRNASFEEAAAILFGGQSAVYFLEKAKIAEITNPSVLIYGATGSVGTAALQISRYYKAKITAVCSEQGQALVKELGVENIILYDKEDFTQTAEKFDIIFDAAGKTTRKQCAALLKENGRYVTVGGLDVAAERKEQLKFLRTLFESGNYKATIDRVYTLDEIIAAHQYVDTGRKKGNVVIKIGE